VIKLNAEVANEDEGNSVEKRSYCATRLITLLRGKYGYLIYW